MTRAASRTVAAVAAGLALGTAFAALLVLHDPARLYPDFHEAEAGLRAFLAEMRDECETLRATPGWARLSAALRAKEDRSMFRQDPAPVVSARGIVRAAVHNLLAGRVVAGGSTVAQQVANRFVPNTYERRTFARKGFATALAWRVLRDVPNKNRLLAYAALLPITEPTGAEPAARYLFGHGVADLDMAEALALAQGARRPAALLANPQAALHAESVRSAVAELARRRFLGAEDRAAVQGGVHPVHDLDFASWWRSGGSKFCAGPVVDAEYRSWLQHRRLVRWARAELERRARVPLHVVVLARLDGREVRIGAPLWLSPQTKYAAGSLAKLTLPVVALGWPGGPHFLEEFPAPYRLPVVDMRFRRWLLRNAGESYAGQRAGPEGQPPMWCVARSVNTCVVAAWLSLLGTFTTPSEREALAARVGLRRSFASPRDRRLAAALADRLLGEAGSARLPGTRALLALATRLHVAALQRTFPSAEVAGDEAPAALVGGGVSVDLPGAVAGFERLVLGDGPGCRFTPVGELLARWVPFGTARSLAHELGPGTVAAKTFTTPSSLGIVVAGCRGTERFAAGTVAFPVSPGRRIDRVYGADLAPLVASLLRDGRPVAVAQR